MAYFSLAVRVRAGARRNRVLGFSGGVLRVQVAAPAVEGKANEVLLAYLAELLGARPRQLAIVRGLRAPAKVVRVDGLDQREIESRLSGLAR